MSNEEKQLRKDIERLEAAYKGGQVRNAYRIGERLRVKLTQLAKLTNNVIPIDGEGWTRKEIVWSKATKTALTHMASGFDMPVKPFIENQLELIAGKGVDYQSLLNENEFLRTTLIRAATESEAFIAGFEDDESQDVRELLTFLLTIIGKS